MQRLCDPMVSGPDAPWGPHIAGFLGATSLRHYGVRALGFDAPRVLCHSCPKALSGTVIALLALGHRARGPCGVRALVSFGIRELLHRCVMGLSGSQISGWGSCHGVAKSQSASAPVCDEGFEH
eukprot:4753627-Pyramimonas_sp.AAC.2